MNKMVRAFVAILVFGFSIMCFAQPPLKIQFEDYETLRISLSNEQTNEIVVEGDAIISINGRENSLAKIKLYEGAAYVNTSNEASFTLYIKTSKGHRCALEIKKDNNLSGKTVLLVPKNKIVLNKNPPKIIANREAVLINFSVGMINAVKKPARGPIEKCGIFEKRQVGKFKYSNGYLGYVYELKNTSKRSVVLDLPFFHYPSTLLISAETDELGPKETTYIYFIEEG